MNLELWKQKKKELKLTIADISTKANLPKGTVQNIFCGYIPNPRTDTVEAIEKALGLDKQFVPDVSIEEKAFFEAFRKLTEEEKKEFFNIANFILSKRK